MAAVVRVDRRRAARRAGIRMNAGLLIGLRVVMTPKINLACLMLVGLVCRLSPLEPDLAGTGEQTLAAPRRWMAMGWGRRGIFLLGQVLARAAE